VDLTINNNKVSLTDGENFFDTQHSEWFDVSNGLLSISPKIKSELVKTYGSEQAALQAAQQIATNNPGLEYPDSFDAVTSTVWLLAFMSCPIPDS
jgi:hypothetical protein